MKNWKKWRNMRNLIDGYINWNFENFIFQNKYKKIKSFIRFNIYIFHMKSFKLFNLNIYYYSQYLTSKNKMLIFIFSHLYSEICDKINK